MIQSLPKETKKCCPPALRFKFLTLYILIFLSVTLKDLNFLFKVFCNSSIEERKKHQDNKRYGFFDVILNVRAHPYFYRDLTHFDGNQKRQNKKDISLIYSNKSKLISRSFASIPASKIPGAQNKVYRNGNTKNIPAIPVPGTVDSKITFSSYISSREIKRYYLDSKNGKKISSYLYSPTSQERKKRDL